MRLLFIFIFSWFISCGQEQPILVNTTSLSFNAKDENELIKAYSVLNTLFKEKNYTEITKYWEKNQTNLQDYDAHFEYHKILEKTEGYTTKLLALKPIKNNKFTAKIAWINPTNQDLICIYNLTVNKNGKLENVFLEKLADYKYKKINNISLFAQNDKLLKEEDIKRLIIFNNKMSSFFDISPLGFQYVIFENMIEMKKELGYDFDSDMYLGPNIGGVAYTRVNIIFSGNGSAFYPHELVHLYTEKINKKTIDIIDEGLATYFGGTQGLTFNQAMEELNNSLKEHQINAFETIFIDKRWKNLTDALSLEYSYGAFLCHLILTKHDKKTLFKLIKEVNNLEDFIYSLENIFEIDREELDQFIKNELNTYINNNK